MLHSCSYESLNDYMANWHFFTFIFNFYLFLSVRAQLQAVSE